MPKTQGHLHGPVATQVDPLATTPHQGQARPAEGTAADGLPAVPGYEVLGVLGKGGMGVVYKARQVGLDRIVALKMIRSAQEAGPEERERFRTEAQAVARLQHPHIVQVHEVGECQGLPYFSLEFCPGGSLKDKLDGTPWEAKSAARLVETLARAMHAAHECNIIHRDLKPANVLLSFSGRSESGADPTPLSERPLNEWAPKISDFGLAKRLDLEGRTQEGVIVGTPSYMPPEQAGGKPKAIGPAADIYSLGAILYELLTGRPPFKAATPLDTVLQVLGDEPVAVRRLQPKTPRDLETLCQKCLQKDPKKRYSSAVDLAEDLRRFQAGEPVRARPAGGGERLRRWCRRHPARAIAGLLGVVAAAAVLTLAVGTPFTLRLRQEQGRTQEALLEAQTQRAQAQTERNRAERLAASQAIDRHLLLCEEGDLGRGLLRLAHSLATAPEDSDDLRRVCQINLAAWARRLMTVKALINAPADNPLLSPSVSPDGRTFLTASGETARLWDAATGQPIGAPLRQPTAVGAMTFTADSRKVLTGGTDGTVRFWDTATGNPLGGPVQTGGPVVKLLASPDGKTILTGDDAHARLWDAATRQPIGPPLPNDAYVWPSLFSPDGRFLATRSAGATTVTLWETATGKQIGQPLSFGQSPSCLTLIVYLAFSPDSRLLLVGCSFGRSGQLLEAATGKVIETPVALSPQLIASGYALGPNVRSTAAFSPDGRTLATTCADGSTRLFEAATGKQLGKALQAPGSPRPPGVSFALFSPDGKTLLTGSGDNTAQLWNAATGEPIGWPLRHEGTSYPVSPGPGAGVLPRGVFAGEFSADGQIVMTAGQDRAIRFWSAATGAPLFRPLRHHGPLTGLRLSADRRLGASETAAGSGWLWETATGRPLRLLPPHQGPCEVRGFCAGGQTLLTSSRDGSLRLLEVPSAWADSTRLPLQELVTSVAFSPDGNIVLAGGTDGTARQWEAANGKPLGIPLRHNGAVTQVAFSPDARTILTATFDQGVNFWDVATGKRMGSPPPKHGFPATVTTFSIGGNAVLFRNQAEAVQLWDLTTGKPAGPPLHHSRLRTMALSPNGRTALTGGVDGSVQLWDAVSGQPIGPRQRHESIITFATFSPDGRTALTGSFDKTARLWDTANGNPVGEPLQHPGGVAGLAFSPDGKTFLTGCQDMSARFWDAATGAPLGPRLADEERSLPHEDYVWTVAFSPDGRFALTGTKGQALYLWEVATRKPIGTLRHDGAITGAAFSPDSNLLLTGSADATARLWDTATGKPVGPPLPHGGPVDAVAFSPTRRVVLTGGKDFAAHLWPVPEAVPGRPEDAVLWAEVQTGMELDADGVVRWLDALTWQQRRTRLKHGDTGPR
jgi:WD40 repeat protein